MVAAVVAAVVTLVGAACGGSSDDTSGGSSDSDGSTTSVVVSEDGTAAATAPLVEQVTIAAPSLADNLLGDPAEVEVAIRTPAAAATSDERYPVVYFLQGYGEPPSVASIGGALDDLVAAGAAPDMIVVSVSGRNGLGGSFYVDSPVTGDWARAVHEDVVGWVDANYPTIAERDARGIAGFSMGGFGALDLAMRHADVFGAVYALSPGLFDPSGLAESQMFADPETVAQFIAGQEELAAMPPADAADSLTAAMGTSADTLFSTAYGAAFAPDPEAGPPYVAYPFDDPAGAPDPEVWARWEAGFGGIEDEAQEFADELRSLRGMLVDYGVNDEYAWIPPGAEYYAEQLAANDVPVRLEQFDGGHGPASVRAEDVMWPFFAEVLASGAAAANGG
jgi:enterochelin esterase-like enzyme